MKKTPVWVITADMANEHQLADQGRGSIVNLEIIRAGAVTAELKLNIEKAHKLIHTARNLITVRGLMLEQIHWRKHRSLTNHQPYSSCVAHLSCCSEIIR